MSVANSHESYLENQIHSASPAKLRLLLIEGAIRFGELAKAAHADGHSTVATERAIRMRDIIAELFTLISAGGNPVAIEVRRVYAYLFAESSRSFLVKDFSKIDDLLKVLREEATTWRLVCENEGSRPSPSRPVARRAESEPSISFEA